MLCYVRKIIQCGPLMQKTFRDPHGRNGAAAGKVNTDEEAKLIYGITDSGSGFIDP